MDKMRTYDVLIVGAGPAGSVCASLLKRAGLECLLIDHASFPRDKICGGGLTPKAWQTLGRLFPDFKYEYMPITNFGLIIDGEHCGYLRLDDMQRMIRIVRRKDFDHLLLQQYLAAGGAFEQGAFADFSEDAARKDYPVVVTLRSGEQIACRYLVGADGATSQVRKRIAPHSSNGFLFYEQYHDRAADVEPMITLSLSNSYSHGYFYVFPNKTHDVIGFGDAHTSKDSFKRVLKELDYPYLTDRPLRGAFIPRASVVSPSPRVILIGDAGGFTNRVSYEGLYYAIATAENASRAIIEGRDFREVNRKIFRKKRKEDILDKVVYSRFGLSVIKRIAHFPRFFAACYNFYV